MVREISKKFEESVTGTLGELAARYADAAAQGRDRDRRRPARPAAPAGDADIEAALTEAMTRLSASRAAAEVAQALGLPRREVYERALARK